MSTHKIDKNKYIIVQVNPLVLKQKDDILKVH